MGTRYAVLLLAAGCRQLAGLDDPLPSTDAVPAGCAGTGDWMLCISPSPPVSIELPPTIVTSGSDRSSLCRASADWRWIDPTAQPDACVIAATRFDIATAVRATGALPLVLVARDTIMISAAIDVASHTELGAGAGIGACGAFAITPVADTQGGGGGAGGSFTSRGGNGGAGDNTSVAAGAAGTTTTTAQLRGGCPGQDGADGSASGSGGSGGGAGRAIYLAAGTTIALTGGGSINASGSGGRGGGLSAGAGGGGSGGMIVLHAPLITSTAAVLLANGGGGGSGGSGAASGAAGADPSVASPTMPAAGAGGVGGNGFAGGAPATPGLDVPSNIGGAGGGGGGGAIHANVPIAGGTSSPAVTLLP